jgi:hypothetical protein
MMNKKNAEQRIRIDGKRRTSNVQRPMMNEKQKQGQELIKIFVTSIKTAEKKRK